MGVLVAFDWCTHLSSLPPKHAISLLTSRSPAAAVPADAMFAEWGTGDGDLLPVCTWGL